MTAPEQVEPPVEPPAPEPVRRPWLLPAVAVVALLLGAAAATGIFLATGLPGQPMLRYSVSIYLDNDVTAEQKAAIEAALTAFDPVGDVTFETREEAWRKFQAMAKDMPSLPQSTKPEDLPESFRFETEGRTFDCTGYTKVRHMPGVDQIQVLQHRVNGYGATIVCDAAYAKP